MTAFGSASYWKNRILNFWDSQRNTNFRNGVWATCPWLAIQADPSMANVIIEDFNNFHDAVATTTLPGYTCTTATTGTVAIDDAAGGVLLIDSDSSTASQGLNVQKVGECFLPAANKDIWFEARFKIVDTYDKVELFVGLSNTDTTIIVTSANSSTEHIGWQCVTTDGVLLFSAEKSSAGATKASATIAENTYIKVAFHVNGVDTIDHWVNDVLQTTQHVTANISLTELTPSFVCHSDGTNDPILHLDYYACVQLR